MLYTILLYIHIIAGFSTLISAIVAIFTKVFDISHRIHLLSGRVFFFGMAFVFVTTLALVLLKPNHFLLLIGIFSFYMAFSGWRAAKNRKGIAGIPEYAATSIMTLAGLIMLGIGVFNLIHNNSNGIILLVFGGVGCALAYSSYRGYQSGRLKGKERIGHHLGMMMGATIAALTAFLVTNFQTNPVWILWIAPTAVITPLIFMMSNRIAKKKPDSKNQAS